MIITTLRPFTTACSGVLIRFSLVFSILLLFSCTQPTGGVPDPDAPETAPVEPGHYLTVQNKTSHPLSFVRWFGSNGIEYRFEPDQVYDASVERYVGGMFTGSECRVKVTTGSSPLRFFFADNDEAPEYETTESIIIGFNTREKTFELTGTTPVVNRQ